MSLIDERVSLTSHSLMITQYGLILLFKINSKISSLPHYYDVYTLDNGKPNEIEIDQIVKTTNLNWHIINKVILKAPQIMKSEK